MIRIKYKSWKIYIERSEIFSSDGKGSWEFGFTFRFFKFYNNVHKNKSKVKTIGFSIGPLTIFGQKIEQRLKLVKE